MSDFGDRLRRIRRERRLTQEQLENKTGLSSGYVAKLEGGTIGNARLSTLERLAEALDIEVSAFFGEVGDGDVEGAVAASDLNEEDQRFFLRAYHLLLKSKGDRA